MDPRNGRSRPADPQVVIVADDLTGAADTGAGLGGAGLTTLVLLPALMSWAGPWLFPEEKQLGAFAAADPQPAAA